MARGGGGLVAVSRKARLASILNIVVVLMLAVCVSTSFAEGQIHVVGIDPSPAFVNSTVRVFGDGATPNGVVLATLSEPLNRFVEFNNDTGQLVTPQLPGSYNLTLGSTVAGDSGDWQISFATPNVPPGNYAVYVRDDESLTRSVVGFTVLTNGTYFVLPPGIGIISALANMTSPFTAPWLNTTIVHVIVLMNVTTTQVPTSGFNTTYIFPNITSLIPVPGPNSTYLQANITSLPLLYYVTGNAVPSSGPPGTPVSLSGTSASGGEIDVYFDNSLVAKEIGQHGAWTAFFAVPNVALGNYTIRAIDTAGRWISIASFTVTRSSISLQVSMPLAFSVLLGLIGIAVVLAAMLFMWLLAVWTRRQKQPK
jgi:hypothetical protein